MIRECYPESVLLGSVDHPVEISQTCSPVTVETDGTIAACICREDFCNGIEHELSRPGPSNETSHQALAGSEEVLDEIDIAINESPVVSSSSGLICAECGSLFSGKNSDCQIFDETNTTQQAVCQPDQACLYYSWQKSKAVRRELQSWHCSKLKCFIEMLPAGLAAVFL